MWIRVTQKLPDKKVTNLIVNTDLIERISYLDDGSEIHFQIGSSIEVTNGMNELREFLAK